MDYITAQRLAFTSIEASNEKLIKTMSANYQEAFMFLRSELDRLYAQLATIKPDDWYNWAIKTDRLNTLVREFQRKFKIYSDLAGQQTYEIIAQSMSEAYYRQQYINACFMPEVMKITVLPPNLIEACVTGQAEAIAKIKGTITDTFGSLEDYLPKYGGTLNTLLKDRNYEALTQIQQAVYQGILQGQSINDVTESISRIYDAEKWKIERIARTESLRTASAGQWAYTQELVNAGVSVKKTWLCNLDDRTRSSHRQLDGKRVEVNDRFKINGHTALYPRGFGVASEDIQCRCTYITLAGDLTPQTRTAYNPETKQKEVFSFKTYNEWKANINTESISQGD